MYTISLSRELQIGKAGEHLVCCDLIEGGLNAFLADQGLPYDVLVDIEGIIRRLQVKTCTRKSDQGKSKDVYRFSIRTAKGARRAIEAKNIDYIAFVFLDKRIVQYIPVEMITAPNGFLKQCIDFRETGNTKYVIGNFPSLQI